MHSLKKNLLLIILILIKVRMDKFKNLKKFQVLI